MSLVDNVKDAVKLIQQLDDVDLMRKMLDVQTDAMKVFEENANLKQEVERLEEILELSGDVFFEANAYWLRVSDEEKHGPFCSQCLGQ